MKNIALADLQASVQDKSAFGRMDDYAALSSAIPLRSIASTACTTLTLSPKCEPTSACATRFPTFSNSSSVTCGH